MTGEEAPPAVAYEDLEGELEEHERAREAGAAGVHEFAGRALEPFSVHREAIFLSQRVSMHAPPFAAVLDDGEAWFVDALRLVWLCSHTAEEIIPLERRPQEMQAAIMEWAEGAGVRAGELRNELFTVAFRIWNEAHRARPEAIESERPGRSEDSGN